uniref:L-ornithine N(5)-monooxygenase [NAD(P)H] n=1 Tax=Neogobius melanostomus TaxID=47308 RepID=A0A8C6UT74_9GOBI
MIIDVLIIGAGPHALTLSTLLSGPCPATPTGQGRRKGRTATGTVHSRSHPSDAPLWPRMRLSVVDSYGHWAALWEGQFEALNIPHLRSHTLVHTDPFNKKALQDFVAVSSRSSELHSIPDQVYILDENAYFNDMRLGKKEQQRLNVSTTLKKSACFCLPGTGLSVDFFKRQVKRYNLDSMLLKGTVESILPVIPKQPVGGGTDRGAKRRVQHFCVRLQDGSELRAHRIVMATGPTRAQMANIPPWVAAIEESYPEGALQHTVQLMHRQSAVCTQGQRVMVVGGGLTSAHIVSIALQQGASHVTWVMRKYLQLKQFDVGDVESLVGRYSHMEHGVKLDGRAFLRQFYSESSLHRRLAMIRQARKGGAVTPEAYSLLQPFIRAGQVDIRTYCEVSEAKWCYRSQEWSLSLTSGGQWSGDKIWLATGCKLDVKQDPLLSEVMKEFPIQVLDGWPCITDSLQWAEGCPLYLMGQYTALRIGPHAVNLAGGQAASHRIAKHIRQQLQKKEAPTNDSDPEKSDRSKAEEYVQQMYGLLWL